MVFVKGGTFQMGTDDVNSNEEPVHPVTLDSFYIGKFEVTQQEWQEVMGSTPYSYKGENLPAHNISWYMAVEYCNKKSRMDGLTPCYTGTEKNIQCNFDADGYRLPTEAEWEFACRGGLQSRNYLYSGGNNPDEVAWHESNCGDRIQPVGRKKPNELGIYDMSGNVWEWCWDWHESGYYQKSPPVNPRGPSSGSLRIYRSGQGPGGQIEWMRSTFRAYTPPTTRTMVLGFRVVKNTEGKRPENMVLVKGGTFRMGSNEGGNGEKAVHTVTLGSFYIGKYEVIQEEWCRVMGKNLSYFRGIRSPVDSTTWYNAVEYCNKRSRMEGLTPCYTGSGDDIVCDFEANGYRLPTEAEWEYASRGGSLSRNYIYSGSNDPNEVGWSAENSFPSSRPVGQQKANELGIYDMSGNVWEWCWDWYDREYYRHSPSNNPTGPASGVRRVMRSGSVHQASITTKSAFRLAFCPHHSYRGLGFRVVRTAK
jgi:formylglycine-generating enzyme required for sulfatase activity